LYAWNSVGRYSDIWGKGSRNQQYFAGDAEPAGSTAELHTNSVVGLRELKL